MRKDAQRPQQVRRVPAAQWRECLASMLSAARSGDRAAAVLMLDLQRSDRLGALTGEREALARTAKIVARLERLLRPEDRLAQVSEDEIWLALPNLPHPQIAVLVVSRILDTLDRFAGTDAPGAGVRPCIGVACYPGHGQSLDELLAAADAARRMARTAEDRYAVHQPAQAGSGGDAQFASQVKAALRANELELYYQPQVDLRSRDVHAAEALIRWQQRDGQQVSPTRIAEAAEQGEMLHDFLAFVLNTALRHMVTFERDRLALRVSVNVSAMLVADPELPAIVGELIDTWNISPAQLTLEVTERAIVSDAERCAKVLHALKGCGVRLAMDDFGTGYSSLAHLKLFPFDEMKIDQLFVRNMLQSPGDLQIVRAMIELGHNFNMEIVAEGVEDQATLGRLRELRCDVAQGYAIARPMSVEALGRWWRAQGGAAVRT